MTEPVYVVALEGVAETRPFDSLPPSILRAASQAINRTADRTRTSAAREILKQVAFPPSYLNPSQGRLAVTKKASTDDLEARITARARPTMLARFAVGGSPGSGNGVRVQVAPGFSKFMKRAFLITLPAGRGGTDTKGNLGVAIRLRPGEVIHNKKVMQRLRGNLYLLFGPSVDQVFTTVREDVSPEAQDFLATEFSRLLELDL